MGANAAMVFSKSLKTPQFGENNSHKPYLASVNSY
jgi:hypothetical protein